MHEFRRRTYPGLRPVLRDLRALLARRDLIRAAMRDRLDPAFRERLMLVVTEVNGCRYCSYVHAREALAAGIPPEQIEDLAAMFDGCPAHTSNSCCFISPRYRSATKLSAFSANMKWSESASSTLSNPCICALSCSDASR